MGVNLKSLIARLNSTCRGALEGAAGLCLSRTNYDVEPEHFLLKLIESPDTDLAAIFRRYEINQSRVTKDLTAALDKLKTGNARTPGLSPRLPQLIQEAWLLASVDYGAAQVRSGHLLVALLASDDLRRLAREMSREFASVSVDSLKKDFAEITATSAEAREATSLSDQPLATGAAAGGPVTGGKTKSLDQFTIDLTARARAGKIDPVLGRDFEIRQVIDILTRRRQNNPILTGEAGVGKTAVVEGFALRIAEGDVPDPLKNVAVRTLDLGLLQAGAGIKGEFENRLKSVIDEVKGSSQPIILFIDEAHTMIGAGGQAGQNDAANLLKPALARGELRTQLFRTLLTASVRGGSPKLMKGLEVELRDDLAADPTTLIDSISELAAGMTASGLPAEAGSLLQRAIEAAEARGDVARAADFQAQLISYAQLPPAEAAAQFAPYADRLPPGSAAERQALALRAWWASLTGEPAGEAARLASGALAGGRIFAEQPASPPQYQAIEVLIRHAAIDE